jgi:N utilization substance protein A
MKKRTQGRDELGPDSAGQSGDIQQMPAAPTADSESVEELAEEGNAFEANAVDGVEEAADPDVSEVTTREVPEDDVPGEYLDEDEHVA